MRETGPVRKDLGDDQEAAAPYIGVARTLLGVMKNRMRMGGLAQLAQRAMLPDGTVIEVASRFGHDTIRIAPAVTSTSLPTPTFADPSVNLPADEAPTIGIAPIPLEQPEFDKCLLVIFNGNEIAAIPMASLDKAKWGAEYRGKIKNAIDPDYQAEVAQYNFGVPGTDSIFLSDIYIQDNTVLSGSKYWMHVVKGDKIAAVQTQSWGGLPAFNASGSTVYGPDGIYAVSDKGVPSVTMSLADAFTYAGAIARPRGITPDGTYLFSAGAYGRGLARNGALSTGTSVAFISNNIGPSGGSTAPAYAASDTQSYVVGSGLVDTGQSFPSSTDGTRDLSQAVLFPYYTKTNGRDGFSFASVQMGCTATAELDLGAGSAIISLDSSASALGWGATGHWEYIGSGVWGGQANGYVSVGVLPFPPPLSTTQVYANLDSSDGTSSAVTPYFTSNGGVDGWMHLSNGQRVMQGFYITDDDDNVTHYLYLDGADVRAALEAAIKTDLSNVQAMFIDIPLSVIKQLK